MQSSSVFFGIFRSFLLAITCAIMLTGLASIAQANELPEGEKKTDEQQIVERGNEKEDDKNNKQETQGEVDANTASKTDDAKDSEKPSVPSEDKKEDVVAKTDDDKDVKTENNEKDKEGKDKSDKSKSAQKPEEKKKDPPKPDTLKLEKERLRLTSKLNGVFEPKRSEQVRLKGEEFSNFELLEVVLHGSKVRRGDILAKFDPKKYDEALKERKRSLRLAEISLKEDEINFKYQQKRQPLRKETLELNKQYADEDFVYYLNVEQGLEKKMIAFGLKIAQFNIDAAKEELRQLEKMYEEDDLIEDTEEFILKRTRLMVEIAEFRDDLNKIRSDRMSETTMPRMEKAIRHASKMEQIDYDSEKETSDFAMEQARLRLERSKEAYAKQVEQFEKFVKDKQMLTLRAPRDGIVYYGEYNSEQSPGKWNGASTIAGALKIKESVPNKQVLFTIVDPMPDRIRATVSEKDLHWIDVGTRGTVAPTAFPDKRFKVRVAERDASPTTANNFGALLTVELPKDAKIFPNMTGSVELVVYEKKETILVPTAALKREDAEDDSWNHAYLYVYKKNETVDKAKIKTGQIKGDKTEVLDGVRSGDEIFKTFAAAEKWMEDEKKRKESEEKEKKDDESSED